MAARGDALFDSDDSEADWEGFAADEVGRGTELDDRRVNLSDIEVSSVGSSDLSDFGLPEDEIIGPAAGGRADVAQIARGAPGCS